MQGYNRLLQSSIKLGSFYFKDVQKRNGLRVSIDMEKNYFNISGTREDIKKKKKKKKKKNANLVLFERPSNRHKLFFLGEILSVKLKRYPSVFPI